VSDPIGSHGLRLGLTQPLNLNPAYHRVVRLPLNQTLSYLSLRRLPVTWPTSQRGTWPLTCMHFFSGKPNGLQQQSITRSLTYKAIYYTFMLAQ